MSYDAAQEHARQKTAAQAQRVEKLRAELRALCRRLPASYAQWGAARAAAFKRAAAAGLRAASDPRATEALLAEHVGRLRALHE
jgi:alpha-D-ribose 1-methylphosphonate 5-triphosphate diphosphatase PhnM